MPITNGEIADVLDEVADLLDFQGVNAFRIRAYRNGARAIRDLSEPIAAMIDQGRDLTKLGGHRQKHRREVPRAGGDRRAVQQLAELRKQIPGSVLELDARARHGAARRPRSSLTS